MRDSTERWIALTLLLFLLTVLVPAVAFPAGREAWMRVSRAVVPNASSHEDFMGKPVSFLSVGGPRWVSWSEQKRDEAAYHVLLLLPSASAIEKERTSGNDGYHHTATRSWRLDGGVPAAEVRFEARYDAVWRRVEIGGRRYSLSRGNVFVVRLAEGRQPSVAQIDTILAGMEAGRTLERVVMAKLPGDDPAHKALRNLYRRDDCESRKPSLSGAGGEKKS